MSRGFVKEDDLEHAGTDVPERPVSAHPNYVTANGYLQLQNEATRLTQAIAVLKNKKDDPQAQQALAMANRDLRYIATRLDSALQVNATPEANIHAASGSAKLMVPQKVVFGATVTAADADGNTHNYTIVGEDEADIKANKISWVSPLAKALIGQKVGDWVVWARPAGNADLEIIAIKFD